MKKHLQLSVIILALGVFLFAQEKTEVSVKVMKDGKVVKDTTYTFDDAKKAKHAIHMFDVMSSDEMEMHFTDSDDHDIHMHKDGKHKKHEEHIIYISEDGEKVKKLEKENVKWISKGDEDGNVRVIVKEFSDGDCEDGKKKVIKKEITVISGEDGEDGEDGEWTIKEIEGGDNVEVIIIKSKKGDGDEEEIKVEVIMKEEKEMQKKKMVKKEEIKKKEKQRK